MRHTKGCWKVSYAGSKLPIHIFEADSGVVLGAVDKRADALLMAAAPEMYEAIIAAQRAIHSGIDADPKLWSDAEKKMDAALKKTIERN